jgi:hypothetical protein
MVAAAAENGYTSEARGITADARSWGTARTKAREYADQHDPAKIAERTAQLNFTPKLLTDAFDKFFTAKCAGGTGEKSIANLTTPRNQLVEYVSQHNASQVEKIVYVHEITPEFLTDWMGTWKDRTHYSKGKKRKNVSAALDQAQPRRRYAQNLQADLTIGDSPRSHSLARRWWQSSTRQLTTTAILMGIVQIWKARPTACTSLLQRHA